MPHQNSTQNSSKPIPIPSNESTPLLPNSDKTKWYQITHCTPSHLYSHSHEAASSREYCDRFLSCSPMVSGVRTLHLPNLELRDAVSAARDAARGVNEVGRVASIGESALIREDKRTNIEGRRRSKSLGDERDRYSIGVPLVADGVSSELSLPFVNNDSNMNLQYGSDIQQESATQESEEATMGLRQSQSCTIPNLSLESPRPLPSPTNNQNNTHEPKQSPLLSILYGIINTTIVLPVLMSFGSIIYHDDFFRPHLSQLMKLTVLSGAVHQLTFSTVSSLPFAVGQVQDAGLIFLSAMSADLVRRLRGEEEEVVLATVCVGLSLGTAMLGVALIGVGKLRLAGFIRVLPGCVVGGYLAYIGFFCGQAGLALMAQENVSGLNEWGKFYNQYAIIRILPGILGGICIYYAVRTFRHMAVLPSCITLLMLSFYGVLWIMGVSVEEATANGWINESTGSQDWTHTWDLLRPEKVVWSVLPSQFGTLLAMIFVVALSSSLDVAAIEIELKRPLDYNHELCTVGISNVVSGLTGGYTGSYIFSQTIFSLRMGIRSRLMGYVLAFLSIVAVVIPFNILSYVPNAFFGSLLMLICLDLMFEWLIDVRSKLTSAEYFVVLTTFCLLQVLGVEFGIFVGVVVYFIVKKMGFDLGS